MPPITFWLRLHGYGVLVLNPDGTITYGTWDYETDTFTMDPSGNAWISIEERDQWQSDQSIWVSQAGVLENGIFALKLDFEVEITFPSLREAARKIAAELAELGYNVDQSF